MAPSAGRDRVTHARLIDCYRWHNLLHTWFGDPKPDFESFSQDWKQKGLEALQEHEAEIRQRWEEKRSDKPQRSDPPAEAVDEQEELPF